MFSRVECSRCVRRQPRRAVIWAIVGLLAVSGGLVRAQTLSVTPDAATTLRYAGPQGGPFTLETSDKWTLGDTDHVGLTFTAGSNQAWLTPHPASGAIGAAPGASADVDADLALSEAEGLAPGVYSAVVTFTNTTNGQGTTTRTVRLSVAPASFTVFPTVVSGSGVENGVSPASVTVTLTGVGGVDLNWRATPSLHPWLSVDHETGTVQAGGSASFKVQFNSAGLRTGSYSGYVDIVNTTNGAGTTQVPVTLTISPAGTGAVSLSPDVDISVRGPAGQLVPPAAQTCTLTNSSDRFVLWQATLSESWVSVSLQGGELAPAGRSPDRQNLDIRANVAINDLPAGAHVATVTFENITTGVPIAARVVRVIVDPVLTISGAGELRGGTVAIFPSGDTLADAGGQLAFDLGTVVALTADVDDGYEFAGWASAEELENTEDNPLVITMDRARTIGVLLQPIARTLTLSVSGSGTGTVKPIPTGDFLENDLVADYANGSEVTLTAEADAGSAFAGWAGNVPAGAEKDNPLTVVLDRDRTITARFEPLASLDVSVVGDGAVTISPEQDTYAAGTVVTLTAVPDEGQSFTGWSGAAEGTEPTITVTVDGALEIEARFEPQGDGSGSGEGAKFTLSTEVVGDGVVTPAGGEFEPGEEVMLVATPSVGSVFSGWEGDVDGSDLAISVIVDKDLAVRAVFAPDPTIGRVVPPLNLGTTCGATGTGSLLFCCGTWLVRTAVRSRRTLRVEPTTVRHVGRGV